MTEEIKSQIISRRRVFWLAAAVLAMPATLALSDARAQSDQTPAADTTAPKKKSKKTTTSKAKKAKPAEAATDPAAAPAAAPK
jgi:predicted lipid-binding transport protein (Tim44 family)